MGFESSVRSGVDEIIHDYAFGRVLSVCTYTHALADFRDDKNTLEHNTGPGLALRSACFLAAEQGREICSSGQHVWQILKTMATEESPQISC